jgi:eukaryotic-like serine/threonine-protein kinase
MATSRLQAKLIFLSAVEIASPEARQAFVESECGENGSLRDEVDELLLHQQSLGHFLESPVPELGVSASNGASEAVGTCIGPYTLLEQIGEGGFGVVFLANQERPVKRRVALKIIKPGMDTRQVIARFEAERQALALMDHPNIAKVLDAGTTGGISDEPASQVRGEDRERGRGGEADLQASVRISPSPPLPLSPSTSSGRPYFVMELVQGIPITEYCDQCNLTTRERLELFITVCHAVQHAHQQGVIHRDIKPTNVLVAMQDGRPTPKIIDFGVAKAIGHRLTDQTLTIGFAQMVGTPLYMSPEQAELSPLGVDTRSDIYSLGVLLYELLTGTTTFDKERMHAAPYDELRRIIREDEPLPPSARFSTLAADLATTVAEHRRTDQRRLFQSIRGELDWIVMKCLDKDRNRRYESANSLARDIGRHLADEPVQACPPSPGYRLRKFARRNRTPVFAGSMMLLTLVAGIIGTTWGMVRATRAQTAAVNEAQQKDAALKAARQSAQHTQDQLFLALLNQARAGRFSGQPGQRLDSLAALAKAATIRPDERLRDEAIAALALPDLRRVPVWRPAQPGTTAMTYSGLCRLYASVDAQGVMSIRRIADDHEVQRFAAGTLMVTNRVDFSPDEQFVIALTPKNTVRVWRVADGRAVLSDEPCDARAYAFAPDGRRLAIGQQHSVVYFDLSTGDEILRWPLPAQAHGLEFNAEGDRLAVGYYLYSDIASVYEAATGSLIAELPVGAINSQVIAWHPNGEFLAVSGTDPRIQIWNVSAKQRVAILEGHKPNVIKLMFHPTGDFLASHSWDGTLRLWDPSTGRQLLQLPLKTETERPHISRDGQWLWMGLHGERAALLELIPSREYRTLVSSFGAVAGTQTQAELSPDGRLLAVGTTNGASLWDLQSGRELARLPRGTRQVFFDCSMQSDSERRSTAELADEVHDSEASAADCGPYDLLTSGSAGLLRWPIITPRPVPVRDRERGPEMASESSDRHSQRPRLGLPKQLSPLTQAWFARSADGRAIGLAAEEGRVNKIIDLETGAVQRELGPHPNGHVRALSSDGQWAASNGWHSERVRLWNARTGEMVHEWFLEKQTRIRFTPDSRTLVISRHDEFSFWDVETRQSTRRLRREVGFESSHVAFSPDGKLMALELAPAVIHLIDAATFCTIAKLEDPHGDQPVWQAFTPDGTNLVVVTKHTTAIHIWDLRAIRARLKEINLDWDWPEFAPASQIPGSALDKYTIDVVRDDPEKN